MGVLPLAHQPACRVRKGIRELGLPELELFEVLPSPVEHQVPGNDSQSDYDTGLLLFRFCKKITKSDKTNLIS
ncbi:hypothetical protein F2P81_016261 [Scophthalmus maximus]|uniref:Uncharacterized protein n=1 Tax=Scophthalmus maximus TaxID=52904 RepID=A0A6A4S918_SCOMX|nr:hypothetical protein F2P81_016261 [Scophthalmus maximus]